MNRLLCAFAVFMILALPAAAATGKRSGAAIGIAATVNDDIVTVSDVKNRLQLYLSGNPAKPPADALKKLEQQILDKLIDEKLQLQEAKSLGISVGEDQVTGGFADIARQNKMPPDEFRKRLAASGVKVDSLYDQIRAEIAWSQVVQRKLRPEINVSESEIDSILDQVSQASGKTEYLVSEIFLPVNNPGEDRDAQTKTEKLVKEITKGASFGTVAREFSKGPGADSNGGEIGWVQEGQLDAALDQALHKMEPGQLSPALRTDKGYHILFLKDKRQNKIVTPAPQGDAIVALKQILIPVEAKDPDSIVAAKIARAQNLKSEITSCEAMEEKSKDFPSPGTGDMGRGPVDALPEPLRAAIQDLPVGELSAPLRNEQGIAVVMVCSRDNPAVTEDGGTPLPKIGAVLDKNDENSRNKVAAKIGMQRLSRLQEHYLQDLRATAFIDKRI